MTEMSAREEKLALARKKVTSSRISSVESLMINVARTI